jgi:hypothetical protein
MAADRMPKETVFAILVSYSRNACANKISRFGECRRRPQKNCAGDTIADVVAMSKFELVLDFHFDIVKFDPGAVEVDGDSNLCTWLEPQWAPADPV